VQCMDVELDPPMGLLVLVDEAQSALEQSFEADDPAWLARFLSGWAKALLDMSAAREAGTPLFGPTSHLGANDVQRAVSPLRAQIVIPDESGNHEEWRFETSSEEVDQLADWLVEVGKWQRRASAERETPPGLVGPDSEPEPEIFVLIREERERMRGLIEELRATAPAKGGGGRRRKPRERTVGKPEL